MGLGQLWTSWSWRDSAGSRSSQLPPTRSGGTSTLTSLTLQVGCHVHGGDARVSCPLSQSHDRQAVMFMVVTLVSPVLCHSHMTGRLSCSLW